MSVDAWNPTDTSQGGVARRGPGETLRELRAFLEWLVTGHGGEDDPFPAERLPGTREGDWVTPSR